MRHWTYFADSLLGQFSGLVLGPPLLFFVKQFQFPGPSPGTRFWASKINQFSSQKWIFFRAVRLVLCGNGVFEHRARKPYDCIGFSSIVLGSLMIHRVFEHRVRKPFDFIGFSIIVLGNLMIPWGFRASCSETL